MYVKFFWNGPGYYAGYQFDTAYDGSPMYAYYQLESNTPYDASHESRMRNLGTASWYAECPTDVIKV